MSSCICCGLAAICCCICCRSGMPPPMPPMPMPPPMPPNGSMPPNAPMPPIAPAVVPVAPAPANAPKGFAWAVFWVDAGAVVAGGVEAWAPGAGPFTRWIT